MVICNSDLNSYFVLHIMENLAVLLNLAQLINFESI